VLEHVEHEHYATVARHFDKHLTPFIRR